MDKVTYWIERADYDFDTALDLMKSKRWIYVAFMCHQTLEKTLKAYWTAKQTTDPPYIHNLSRLAELSGIEASMDSDQKMFLDTMTPMNIEARYPDYKSRLAAGLNQNVCEQIINKTCEMASWIKSKL